MTKDTKPGRSILSQVIRGLLISTAIVAIGATILIVLSSRVKRRPNMHVIGRTLTDIQALARAVEGFESEYEKLPNVSSLEFETEGPEAAKLITVLLGKEEGGQSNMQNPRQIAFLVGRMTKHRKQGGIVSSSTYEVGGIYDSWSNPLRVVLRPPGQSTITVSYLGKQVTTSKPAVVLSRGPDQKWGTEDDLISETEKGEPSTPAQKR